MKEFGVDISVWQGDFDLKQAVGEGVRFVIVKGGGADAGYYVDSRFVQNYEKAKALSLHTGVYWFSKALSTAAAQKEADYCYRNILKGRRFELPVYMDVEHSAMLGLGRAKLTDVIRTWCDALEKKGFFVGIYSSEYFFTDYMEDDRLRDYAHWVAAWRRSYPSKYAPGLWQFGGETNALRSNTVAGVVCDQDYMYTDYLSRIREAGLNGYAKQKSVYEIALEVIRGDWGNGEERRRLLAQAGYDYGAVQAEVNRILYG